ncbi:transglutaminase domain-containing protein [Paenibacillus sediminis]|uniref:Transglutaminase-like putative cysteine protease n=1 Tax=Paenibacillus sediminis TaxID=664909 RepID=A0ABS4H638_9BACL|nr:transglutaminase domain-containing protein [Paenibacillus sediminis]MBP1937988.1 transglutaminase-like putative cysteine protease [Paenibacillus sediminis]
MSLRKSDKSPVHRDSHVYYGEPGGIIYRLLLSLLLLGLFGEWLHPLQSVNAANELNQLGVNLLTVFYTVTILLLVIGINRIPMGILVPLQALLITSTMIYLFADSSWMDWLKSFGSIVQTDIRAIVESKGIASISLESRTLLLLIGWCLLVTSVQALALFRQSILLFALATIVYLICLETWADIRIYEGLVRTVVISLLLQALLFLPRLELMSSSKQRSEIKARAVWVSSSFMLAAFCGVFSLMLTKESHAMEIRPISLENTINRLQAWTDASPDDRTAMSASVSGYGDQDHELGASLQLRDEPYFVGISPKAVYWRGESKSYYNGRGWSEPSPVYEAVDIRSGAEGMQSLMSQEKDAVMANGGSVITQKVSFVSPISDELILFNGGIPTRIDEINTQDDHQMDSSAESSVVMVDPIANTTKYAAPNRQLTIGYTLEAAIQNTSPDLLRNGLGSDSKEIIDRYLQLPKGLPQRVIDLAAQITKNSTNRYDAAKAIEDYLKSNYKYRLSSRVPPEGQDFVDHFLFVQKAGYCNHFSTAMAVMLRSQGIPARWVKGFTPGEQDANDQSRFTVRYANAHAWVEVYFPNVGWIPFEPTPGFEAHLSSSTASLKIDQTNVQQPEKFGINDVVDRVTAEIARGYNFAIKNIHISPIAACGWGVSFILLVMVLRSMIKERHRIALWLLFQSSRSFFSDRSQLLAASHLVWKMVYSKYGVKPPQLTLREYISTLKMTDSLIRDELFEFVSLWEMISYSEPSPDRAVTSSFLQTCRKMAQKLA